MCHWTGIFGELMGSQQTHIFNTFYMLRTHVGRKTLVTKNGKAFLQRQLEPVTTGDTVTGPVMEIFVRDNAFNPLEITVSRCILLGKHIFGIEYIQPLVLHCPHVEIINRNDVVDIQVIFAAILFFIPLHRIDQ